MDDDDKDSLPYPGKDGISKLNKLFSNFPRYDFEYYVADVVHDLGALYKTR